jgi:hypothetical protein
VSGDNEASTQSLIVGHIASHVPSRRPRSPPSRGQGSDRLRRMKKNTPPNKNQIWGARLGGIFCTGAPNGV